MLKLLERGEDVDDKLTATEEWSPRRDYVVDEKAKHHHPTERGLKKAEPIFGIENLCRSSGTAPWPTTCKQAIKAHGVMQRDIDYVVKDGEVIIVDEFTGRLMDGRRYSEGLHQAIEAKEGVTVARENQDAGHHHLPELLPSVRQALRHDRYRHDRGGRVPRDLQADVVEIPTNKPRARIDYPDVVYKTEKGKYNAVIEQVRSATPRASPSWWAPSPSKDPRALAAADKRGIEHNVLNAKNHEREAEIVAQAGKYGAVTIATNMAGRGTDIMLGGNAEYLAKATAAQGALLREPTS